MREPLEMVTSSLMQNMMQIRKKNIYFLTKLLLKKFGKSSFEALGAESPTVGPLSMLSGGGGGAMVGW